MSELEKSLQRMRNALEPQQPPAGPPLSGPMMAGLAALIGALAAMTAKGVMPRPLGGLLLFMVVVILVGRQFARRQPGRTHVGMGADVAADATLEPGAVVEMGATVESGAVVRSGAVVKMGATVGARAIIERNAVVSWGADVHEGAVVGEGAVIGAGCDIHAGATVPAGARVMPGVDYRATALPAAAPAQDPREARIAAVCDKLEGELREQPERIREFLGGSSLTIASLRQTALDLLRRERTLRAESGGSFDDERAALQKRIDATGDAQTRAAFESALAAMDGARAQREQVKLAADRLEAESTRLLYTLEGLAAQFARLRSAGEDVKAPRAEIEASVTQLRTELDAITDALHGSAPATFDDTPTAGKTRIRG